MRTQYSKNFHFLFCFSYLFRMYYIYKGQFFVIYLYFPIFPYISLYLHISMFWPRSGFSRCVRRGAECRFSPVSAEADPPGSCAADEETPAFSGRGILAPLAKTRVAWMDFPGPFRMKFPTYLAWIFRGVPRKKFVSPPLTLKDCVIFHSALMRFFKRFCAHMPAGQPPTTLSLVLRKTVDFASLF